MRERDIGAVGDAGPEIEACPGEEKGPTPDGEEDVAAAEDVPPDSCACSISSMQARTRVLVSSLTPGFPLTASETVALESPSLLATSTILTFMCCILSGAKRPAGTETLF